MHSVQAAAREFSMRPVGDEKPRLESEMQAHDASAFAHVATARC